MSSPTIDDDAPDSTIPTTQRTALRRKKERGSYDRALVHAVLDEAFVCHVGFNVDHGPVVLPMAHIRIGDQLYLHGATANAMLRSLDSGIPICATVTLLDGLVLARSAFHHSMNFRSVAVFGIAKRVTGSDEQLRVALALVEHMSPGRSEQVRAPSPLELRKTLIVRLPINEASAKVRTGGPVEEPEDLDLPVWAGYVPMELVSGSPVADNDSHMTGSARPTAGSTVPLTPATGSPQGVANG